MSIKPNSIAFPQHNRFTLAWVTGWFAMLHTLHFRPLVFKGSNITHQRSVLLLQNHFSWWDGYWSWLISRRLQKVFNVMMLQEQIRAHPFLLRCGAFAVEPGMRSVLASLKMAAELLANDQNMVVVFPQGTIQSQYITQRVFASGVSRIAGMTIELPQIVFAVVLVDYFSHWRPQPVVWIDEYKGVKTSNQAIQHAYNEFYNNCVAAQNTAQL